jgi:photosystem II stability/assembly factor-like uncharacterized protein
MRTARVAILTAAILTCPILAANAQANAAKAEASTQRTGEANASVEVWQLQSSGTNAGLRGIFSVDGNVAWASGTGGTVLRTTDGGAHWQHCAIPDWDTDGAKLDFRGVQAWSAAKAIVLAIGPGTKSRLYKTTDGCKSWNLAATAQSLDSFWDAIAFQHGSFAFATGDPWTGVLIGDPVKGRFETNVVLFGRSWFADNSGCAAPNGQAAFAASNSSVFVFGPRRYVLGVGGKAGAAVMISPLLITGVSSDPCKRVSVPITGGRDSSGIFSLWFIDLKRGMAVGGDYAKPNDSTGTAAFTLDGGQHWTASTTPPHGYRSTVQYSETEKAWFTAGTNGSDISRDDGRTWQPLDNGSWNALSLPFIVGPNGRIAKLNPSALPEP